VPPPGKPPEKIMKPAEEIKKETSAATGAKLIVDLPADAKLFIDGRPMNISSQHPVFVTPGLQAGKTYYYDLRAEVVRDGKAVSDFKRVVFHAGDELREIKNLSHGWNTDKTRKKQIKKTPVSN
jgi:uncharacterized protein (TIGR03000 family)